MRQYQQKYIDNIREIAQLSNFYSVPADDFDAWYAHHSASRRRINDLRSENIRLLSTYFFPVIDNLYSASEEELMDLTEFSLQLMDWTTNLDCGLYILIHESLLSMYRYQKNRAGIIRELYNLGMGLYYQDRMIQGIDDQRTARFLFRNEMVFTEAGSYLRFFDEIEDEETKGYIIRALANIAICTSDRKRRVAVSAKILRIVQDPFYREKAPGLPWDTFLRRTHQQMSANRDVLSKGNMSAEELSLILESCQVVFEPEINTDKPNIRWLWPYYEMEYSCGFVDLQTTLARMEKLIFDASYDQYDYSGLYANVQLPIYYGRLIRDNPSLAGRQRHIQILSRAYAKMMKTLMTFPQEDFGDFYYYNITLVITDYYETAGVETYRSVTEKLMRKMSGLLYVDALMTGKIMETLCSAIYDDTPEFFRDLPVFHSADKESLLEYARLCGLYCNFGLIKMNIRRIQQSRNLLEPEYELYQLHAASGYDDLRRHPSTKAFADIALGHHSWYSGGGYPDDYVRNESVYRQMTDIAAVASYLTEKRDTADSPVEMIFQEKRGRFSSRVLSWLHDPAVQQAVETILKDEKELYRTVFSSLKNEQN